MGSSIVTITVSPILGTFGRRAAFDIGGKDESAAKVFNRQKTQSK